MSTQLEPKDGIVIVQAVSVKGGDLPTGFQVYVNLSFNFEGVSDEDKMGYCCEGSSLRVKAQAQLRKWTVAKLSNAGIVATEGLTDEVKQSLKDKEPILFNVDSDFEKTERGPQDPVKQGVKALSKMDAEQRIEFLRQAGYDDLADIEQDKLDAEQTS